MIFGLSNKIMPTHVGLEKSDSRLSLQQAMLQLLLVAGARHFDVVSPRFQESGLFTIIESSKFLSGWLMSDLQNPTPGSAPGCTRNRKCCNYFALPAPGTLTL